MDMDVIKVLDVQAINLLVKIITILIVGLLMSVKHCMNVEGQILNSNVQQVNKMKVIHVNQILLVPIQIRLPVRVVSIRVKIAYHVTQTGPLSHHQNRKIHQ
jgi:hypothetical protein